jgi:hypothetical protein
MDRLSQTAIESRGGQLAVVIGGLPIEIQSENRSFIEMLAARYAGFVGEPANGRGIRLDVEIVEPIDNGADDDDEDLEVSLTDGRWTMNRGDFRAHWDPMSLRGYVRQSAYPYAIDSVMRIVHSLVLAERGGFLLHSASAVRNGKAFLFSGVSGAGKTTISRLAPPDATLLTDEISYVRRVGEGYEACGTPFAGDLGRAGENISAPLSGLYLLVQGRHNHASPIGPADATRRLLRNILFFSDDAGRVEQLFRSACEFVSRVPVFELTFRPDEAVWDLIG